MAKMKPVDTFDLIIFGGSGDLAMRKLLPALYHRDLDGQISADSRIIAVGRSDLTREVYLELLHKALQANLKTENLDDTHWRSFSARIDYVELDAFDPDSWQPLCDSLKLSGGATKIRAIYLATAPGLFGPIAAGFHHNDLMTKDMRIVLEKPVGRDYESAKEINDAVGACFSENQIFRIDHYLGKETVQNLLALRFESPPVL